MNHTAHDDRSTWRNPDPTPDELRRVGYEVVDMIADYIGGIRAVSRSSQ